MNNYFIITCTDDDYLVQGPVSQEYVSAWLKSNSEFPNLPILSKIPSTDGPIGICIIKGEIIIPKAKEVVTKYEL